MNFFIDKNWTLFLDRDGVINRKIDNGYVTRWSDFIFLDGSLEAISGCSKKFGKIIVVTNQRGVGRGFMTEESLENIHKRMIEQVNENGGRIDKIYCCTALSDLALCRKPNIGMAIKALTDFPEIDFKKSIMVGDSFSDLMFGSKLGMLNVLISANNSSKYLKSHRTYKSLYEFSLVI
jgi:D-glycero-D-manno-heptose 1,7-bisphosphate phosphatase